MRRLAIIALLPLVLGASFWRPDGDTGITLWTTAPLWSKIDEVSPSDSDFISSPSSPSGDNFQADFDDASDPGTDSGFTFRVRARKSSSGGSQIDMDARLGGPGCAASGGGSACCRIQVTDISNTWTTYTDATCTNMSNLTDFSGITTWTSGTKVGGGAPRTLDVSWMELEGPSGGRRRVIIVD